MVDHCLGHCKQPSILSKYVWIQTIEEANLDAGVSYLISKLPSFGGVLTL